MQDYQVGDTVTYTDFLGGFRTGIIDGKYSDVKNGRPGFDMRLFDGSLVWGYDSQITQIHS
jgi:hypothetical protein